MPNAPIYAGWFPSWKLSWPSVHPQDVSRTPPFPSQPYGHKGTQKIHGQAIKRETELATSPIHWKFSG